MYPYSDMIALYIYIYIYMGKDYSIRRYDIQIDINRLGSIPTDLDR